MLACPVKVKLKRITFLGDHSMHENAAPGNWGAGNFLSPPDWKDVGNPDHAVCYTRGSPLQLAVLVEASASPAETVTLRVQGPNGIVGTAALSADCGTPTITLNFSTAPTTLPNYVWRYEPMTLTWSYQRQGQTTWQPIGQTTHHMFVSHGTPAYDDPGKGPPTQWRMHWLTAAGLGFSQPLTITDAIHFDLAFDPPLDADDAGVTFIDVDDWDLMSGLPYGGECDEEARLMNRATKLLGLPSGVPYFTYPSMANDCDPSDGETVRTAAQAGITWDIDGDGTIGEEMMILRFDFDGGTGADINAFEGSVEYSGINKYYAVWPSLEANSKCELLDKVRTHVNPNVVQCWDLQDTPVWECVRNPATGLLKEEQFPGCAAGCP